MPFLLCLVPVCPMRAEATHRSEQVSQLLFGELCELLEGMGDFIKVKGVHDNYLGWCQTNQLEEVPDTYLILDNKVLAAGWINELRLNNRKMQIPFGSSVGFLKNGAVTLGKYTMSYSGDSIDSSATEVEDAYIGKIARTFLNTPYLWGGRSVFGIDCSGFTQLVFKFLNIALLRDASLQATQGEAIGFLEEVICGDLAFFDNVAGKITHVGILLNATTIIHSSGKVRIDKMDNLGIVNADTAKRTHQLRVIKRINRK